MNTMTTTCEPKRADWRKTFQTSQGPLTSHLVQTPGKFGLGQIPQALRPDATTNVVCGYCSTGCGLNIHLKKGEAVNLSASTKYPVNLGMACPKGWEALAPLQAPDRATEPLLKNSAGQLEPTSWQNALETFCERFKSIQKEHGNDSIAFLSTGQIVNEEMALLGALAKFGMGMIHCDGNTRQCMATAAVAYKESFGFDAPPYTYQDFEESDTLVFVGSNLCVAHPIMWQRVLRNPHQPEIIVIDPRRTETAEAATQHYAIEPKSDLYLFYGLAHLLIQNGWIDKTYINHHTEHFDAFAEHVRPFSLSVTAKHTGISEERLEHLAETIRRGKRVSFWWTMGVNQSHEGVRIAQAIINLALMTGNIGRPGTGANSITGQCNAMGSRLFSNTTNLLGGHDFLRPEHRRKMAAILGMDPALIPDQNSWPYHRIIEGIAEGKIKGLWVIATNSSHSWIHQNRFRDILAKLDFLVVQDLFHTTETAEQADLLLPAAGWGEKEGTFINSERRIGLVKKISKAPGQALADFHIFKLIAEYWGCGELFRSWDSPEAVFQILKKITRGQPCDITGIKDYRMLDTNGGIQWPLKESISPFETERRLFEDGQYYHPAGRAKFLFEQPRAVAEPICETYPYILLTGRGNSCQWHTQTRTGKSKVLRKLYPQHIYVEIHPKDAKKLNIEAQDKVLVASRRGQVEATAFLTLAVSPGKLFMPMHYAKTNQLTYPDFDPYSHQPSYKHCAVQITKIPG